jgi:ATP/maltotriose-dependent transcriptional regulator MalT
VSIEGPRSLLDAAKRLEPFDLDLARETYLVAWQAAHFSAGPEDREIHLEIGRAMRALPPTPGDPRPIDLLVDGIALVVTEGVAAAAPTLRRAAEALANISADDIVRWGEAASSATNALMDIECAHALATRFVQLVREAGALAVLPQTLSWLAITRARMGDFSGAASLLAESQNVAAATGSRFDPHVVLRLQAMQGNDPEVSAKIADAIRHAESEPHGFLVVRLLWAAAILCNGLARYDEAASAALQALQRGKSPVSHHFMLIELVEAAARTGDLDVADDAMRRLENATKVSKNDFAAGVEARCRALLSEGEAADDLYRKAIDYLSRTRLRPDLARAHLVYGEWLRREGQRVDAREQLRTAHDMFIAMGMEAFGDRARRELAATGETARRRTDEARVDLTPQEAQIVRLAADGLTNPQIGAKLFLSPRTIEWHLRRTYPKLGISSRRDLHTITLPA